MGSVSRRQDLSPCQTEPIAVSSEMDLLLAKAEPISNVAGISVIT